MNIKIDTHMHTIVSGHAYNTMKEMIVAAKDKGMEAIALTDHAPNMPGTTGMFYFQNFYVMPEEMYGVRVLHGAELNILDEMGNVDLPEHICEKLDLTIASIHVPKECYGESKGIVLNTQAYLNAMKNPWINIIGHPDDSRIPVDYDTLVAAAKEHDILLELNNSSLDPRGYRQGARANQEKLLELCKKYKVSISLGSDAHIDSSLGEFSRVIEVLKACDFPENQIANMSLERLYAHINYGKRKNI